MKKNLGFTLVEALISVLLISVGVVVMANMFLSQNKLYLTQNSELEITSGVRTALDDVDNYVRQANRTLSTYSTFTAGPNVLILQIQSIDGSNRLKPGVYDYAVYTLSSGNLTRQMFADATSSRASNSKQLATNVTNLTFTYNNADYSLVTEVATDITASKTAGHQTRTFTVNSKSRLRAY